MMTIKIMLTAMKTWYEFFSASSFIFDDNLVKKKKFSQTGLNKNKINLNNIFVYNFVK